MRIDPLFSAEEVAARIRELATRLLRDYADSPLLVVCIAEGAVRFVDDLLAELAPKGLVPERVDVRARRTEGTSLGPVQVEHFDPEILDDRDVLIVDDIADEGATLRAVLELCQLSEPRSVHTAVLVDKTGRRREPLPLDYVGFTIESGWVIGYGMDVDGEYRELDWIGVLRDERF
ncbi:MAG: phosphoribosyltransferase family protein [Myxococcota bacterium]|nr:phosphoribosyltransferase family protein [Myxococcota bacterium]